MTTQTELHSKAAELDTRGGCRCNPCACRDCGC